MSPRYVCIHGHFYQPPRENPWTCEIPVQPSAAPYRDWNARVTAEAYTPNAFARILDGRGHVAEVRNNYGWMSFNFGPTLLAWMETEVPETYRAVLDADVRSRHRFGGRGSAMAQAHGHLILPLATRRDKVTQVRWGLADFEHRFGRPAEGMWLPETAADVETLEVLAEEGVRFTVLAPTQANQVRPMAAEGMGGWQDVSGGRIDPRRPYLCRLPSGAEIVLFFYDGEISRAVAFEGLLENGPRFAHRLLSGFDGRRDEPQLVHIATDGETYGHHHRHGEMALAYALDLLNDRDGVELTHYGRYLEMHPPTWEVRIVEPSSWSCPHGVERWRSDCGCSTGGEPHWNQRWRTPLREALGFLRDEVGERMGPHPPAPSPEIGRGGERAEVPSPNLGRGDLGVRAGMRADLHQNTQAMYTSCGWFFNDLAGIETVQILRYAARVLELARELWGVDLEEPFLRILERAESNRPEKGNGREIWEREVKALTPRPPLPKPGEGEENL